MSVKEINYILKRVLQMIPVLLLVMVLIFALIRFIPGDPADVMLGAPPKNHAPCSMPRWASTSPSMSSFSCL